MIIGKKGSGKTTFITKMAIKYRKKGRPVYSTVAVPGAYLFDPTEIGKFSIPPEAVVFIDEVGLIWDNRNFKSFQSDIRNYFKYQRQYRHTVYLFSQAFDVDLKLRNLTDELYIMRSFCNCFSLARRVLRRITILSASDAGVGESRIVDDLRYDSLLWFWCGSVRLTFLPKYAKYFKSFDPPKLEGRDYVYCDDSILELDKPFWRRAADQLRGRLTAAYLIVRNFMISKRNAAM